MTNRPLLALIPLNDCVLVELEQARQNVATLEGKYDTRTQGILLKMPHIKENTTVYNDLDFLVGKRVFFEEYKEGVRIKRDGKLLSFIKIEDIRGYENVETN